MLGETRPVGGCLPGPDVEVMADVVTGASGPRAGRLGWRHTVLLYTGFFAGVAVVTWPLVLRPASLWPPHHDARVFTWIMASMARRLLSHPPLTLFHGNAFYPAGQSAS